MGVSFAESVANEDRKTQKIKLEVRWVNDDEEDEEEDEDEKGKKKEKEVEEVYFSVNNDMPLRWLMIAYCDKIGVDYNKTCFEFKGARLRETDTPLQLSMLPSDFIHAYRFLYGRSAVNFATICIRMYKEKDTFLRVRRATPLLPQLMRGLSDVGLKEDDSLCFVYEGSRLDYKQTADGLDIQDADIIDAFKFDESCSTSYYVTPCIRMHDEWDMFFRVRSSIAILPQIMRCYPYNGSQEQCSIWFVYGGLKLTENHTANELDMKDGDIIEAFDFKAMRSSLRTVWPAGTRLTLTVKCLTGNVTTFIVTPKTLLGQVMDRLIPPDAVTGRKNIRFVFAGRTLSATNTVEEEELTDGCTIHSIRCLIGC